MFSISKILLPIDFSERSAGAARFAIHLARHFNSELALLHVFEPPGEFGKIEGAPVLEDLLVELQAGSQRTLDAFMKTEFQDLKVTRTMLHGDPAGKIVEYTLSEKPDLIMMATHGYGPFRRFLLGSVTAKVLHDAKCPIWTGTHVEAFHSLESARPGHIVCAIDLGPQSRHTLDWAARMADDMKAPMTIVHVITSLDPHTQTYYLSPEWRKDVSDEALASLGELKKDMGIKAEVKLEFGDVHKGVCHAAATLKADLLVINRGVDGGSGGRLRTYAYAIIRDSSCPVVSV
ncbi:MAG: universal stress protein [Acidobacteriia bacterium]|nr:universal stress protein [Terriglobia bacterium]